ncbi:GGDEF domain-containing protein [Halomonas sp. hl-4]|uniref:GGDEF domain-containing protein n=1 Tax=Halomonas sp. hl-4 TaxID=1761789 RepID=UPI000BB725E7|nr:GGDEF domain-containing protein [Halomonas sp. hl-4]SNY95881.1 diguanylate cyclase (GGDEF) domain-containing protein [Halomonas sp. hl-4]
MSLQEKRYQLHWLTGQFCDVGSELMYRRSILESVRFEYSLALSIAALVFGMFAISDYYLLGLTREFYLLLAMRIVVVSMCLLVAFAIRRWEGRTYPVWLHALPLWILATGIILIVPLRPESLPTQVTAVVVATIAFYLLIPNLLTVVTFASLYLNIGFMIAAVLFAQIGSVGTVRIALLLIMTNVVGFCALLRLESLQRKQYALLHEERDQNHQLHKEIAHRRSLEEQLRVVAERDALTGLNNRGHFMSLAEALLQRSQLEKVPFGFFMIDVDHFKRINDTWGHSHGDWVLAKIAEVCAQSLRPTDVIGRFGGEEFVVALPNTGPDDAQVVAERLKKEVAELPLKEEMGVLCPSVTIGIAVANAEEVDLESLITRADQMLYDGKRGGRNRVVMCHKGVE